MSIANSATPKLLCQATFPLAARRDSATQQDAPGIANRDGLGAMPVATHTGIADDARCSDAGLSDLN